MDEPESRSRPERRCHRQGQPKPGALHPGSHIPKHLEHRVLILRCDPYAGVGDGHLYQVFVHGGAGGKVFLHLLPRDRSNAQSVM